MNSYRSEGEFELLPLSWRWLTPQPSGETSRTLIRRFAAQMLRGDCFPPIQICYKHDGRFVAIDGQHRLAASLLAGFDWIPVIENVNSLDRHCPLRLAVAKTAYR